MPGLCFGASVRCQWSVLSVFGARFWCRRSVLGLDCGRFWGSILVPVVRFVEMGAGVVEMGGGCGGGGDWGGPGRGVVEMGAGVVGVGGGGGSVEFSTPSSPWYQVLFQY